MDNLPREDSKRHESPTHFSFTPCQLMVKNIHHILRAMKKLYEEKKMSDVQFKVGDKVYEAHRLILSASSDVFQVMLMKAEWNESSQHQIVLHETPDCERVFRLFLQYFYLGELTITHTNVEPLLTLADKYMVKSLSNLCLQYMKDHTAHASCYNQLFSWLQYLKLCGPTKVASFCEDFITFNFERVSNSSDFSNMDHQTMVSFLKKNHLVVYNEVELYHHVVKWLNLQKTKLEAEKEQMEIETECIDSERSDAKNEEYMKYLTELVMQYIRFPMIKPREIVDLLCEPLVRENRDFFWDRMSISMELHSGNYQNFTESWLEENKHMIQPRLYTIENYCATLSINNFKRMPDFHNNSYEFNTSSSLYETEDSMGNRNKWIAHLFAKGVLFKPGYLVLWQSRYEIPQRILSTVRLKIKCVKLYKPAKFKFSILIHGVRKNIEHIVAVRSAVHTIFEENAEITFDNIIPYHELLSAQNENNLYLIGISNDELKLQVVITPVP